jgi:hypothetical protein
LNGRIASWTSVGLGWGEAGVDQWILCFDIWSSKKKYHVNFNVKFV